MKRYLFVGVLCLFSLYGLAEYYYYHGEKVAINTNTDSVVIYTPNKIRSNNAILDFQPTIVAQNQVAPIALADSTSISSIGYIIGDTITRKMSNCFYVKLHEEADTILLKDVIEETRTILLGQVPHMDKWYKIMVAYSIYNNTLDMSNYFYETGYFADVDPGFVFEFKPSCRSDYNYLDQWALPAINSCDAWGVTSGSRYVTVAVVDQGIELSHREFIHQSFPSSTYDCFTGLSGIFVDEEPYGEHGTQVASLIAANHNSGYMAGLAPNIGIMPISHPLDDRSWFMAEELASGIKWAVHNGADVINCSWGDQGGDEELESLHSIVLEEAILYAIREGRYGKGCIVVFASGDYEIVDYPAYVIPEILVCGSINDWYQRGEGSGHGLSLDVVAPGENIYLATLGNSYCFNSGTSFAAPHVSAIAALILSLNADLTREEVVNIIEITTQNLSSAYYPTIDNRINGKWNEEFGYGLIDAYAAVLAAQPKYIQNQVYQSGQEVYEYAPEITAGYAVTDSKRHGDVVLEAGSDVTLRGMDRVVLKPGFHAKAGCKLHINVDTPTTIQTASSPQRVAPRTSSAPTDNANYTNEEFSNNGLETVANNTIVSTSIYTISGQLIQNIAGGHHDATHLPNGMYILQHRMSDGSVRSEKIANNK